MYKKKKQSVKFKLRLELIAIFLVIVGMISASVILRLPSAQEKIAAAYNATESGLSNEHLYDEVSFDGLIDEINTGELLFVVFASPDCTESVSPIATINSRGEYWDLERIVYVDATNYLIDEDADDYEEDEVLTKEISELEKSLNVFNTNELADIALEHTPSIWVFNEKELVFNSVDYYDEDDEAMSLSWSQISDRAFCINLPQFDSSQEQE